MSSFNPDFQDNEVEDEVAGPTPGFTSDQALPDPNAFLAEEKEDLQSVRSEMTALIQERISHLLRAQIDDPYMRAMKRFSVSHGPDGIDIDLATSLKLDQKNAEQFLHRWSTKFQAKLVNAIRRESLSPQIAVSGKDNLSLPADAPHHSLIPQRARFEERIKREFADREIDLESISYFRLQLGYASKIIADLKTEFPDRLLPEMHQLRKDIEQFCGVHIRFLRLNSEAQLSTQEIRRSKELRDMRQSGRLLSPTDPEFYTEKTLPAEVIRSHFSQDTTCEDHTERACISIDDAKTKIIEDIQWGKAISIDGDSRLDYASVHVPDKRYGRSLDVDTEMFTFNMGYFVNQDGETSHPHFVRALASNKVKLTPALAEENFGIPEGGEDFQESLDSLAHSAFARRMNRTLSSNIIQLRTFRPGRVVVEEHMYTAYHLFAKEMSKAGVPVIAKGMPHASSEYLEAVQEVLPQATSQDLEDPTQLGAVLLILQEADRMDLFEEMLDTLSSRDHYFVLKGGEDVPVSVRARFKANRLDGELNQDQGLHFTTGSPPHSVEFLQEACDQLNLRYTANREESYRFFNHPRFRGTADLIGSECLGVVRFCSRGEVFVDVRQLGISGIVPAHEMARLAFPNFERGDLLKLRWIGPHPFKQTNIFHVNE